MSDNKAFLDYLKQSLNTANKKGTFELEESVVIFNALEIINLTLNKKETDKERINRAINLLDKALNKANLNGCYTLGDAARISLTLQKIISLINELLNKKESKSENKVEKLDKIDEEVKVDEDED